MSKDLTVPQETDLTKQDLERIDKFIEAGAPGFDLSQDVKITRMMDLYLAGKTYSQIARIERMPKPLVMLYSQKLSWFALKAEYLQELEMHLKGRVVNAKVASQDFLLQMSQMYQKKIGAKMDAYLRTGDESVANAIDHREIDKYLKIVAALSAISADPPPKQAPAPAVGINVGDGVTVTKSEDGSVEITPKQKTIGSMLENLANKRRSDELAKVVVKTSDIKDVTPKTDSEGEKKDETK